MNRSLEHQETHNLSRKNRLVLLCDGVQGPANMGALFRLADAFGVERIYFSDTVDIDSGRLRRTARSTSQWVFYKDQAAIETCLLDYKKEGFLILGLEICPDSVPLDSLPQITTNCCLVIGGEITGISGAVLEQCDRIAHINMFGQNSSMNVAQSAAIALYELSRT